MKTVGGQRKARRTGLRNEAEHMNMLGPLVNVYILCPQTIKYGMK